MKIHQQKIVLTGAASGIGLALMQQLNEYTSISLIAVDIHADRLNEAIRNLKNNQNKIIPFVADLSTEVANNQLFDFALAQMGEIDIFIANAGFAYYEKVGKPDWEHIEKIFQVNVFAPMYALQKMQEINQNRPFYVLMTASAMAKLGVPGYAIYGATKAALGRFEDAYRFEKQGLGKLGLVYPIATHTNFFSATGQYKVPVPFPSQTPEKVAKAMIRGILGNKRAVYPSLVFWIFRFSQWLYEFIHLPYQWYYAKVLHKWLKIK
jgi:short-subunit dehydrogenase